MRTHRCGLVDESLLESEVTLCGWVNRRRDHGGVIFVDLRDAEGIVQVVFDPDDKVMFDQAETIRNEHILRIRGRVRDRPEGMINNNITSGKIEVFALELETLSASDTPPFQLDDDVNEDIRLKYRYVDLRRSEMQERIKTRAKMSSIMRHYLEDNEFLEIETPIMTKATPEGARDYLVPSRTHPGNFFALPQSPQLFKQMLMMGGIDRYYQMARCFRDEDLRADRQPEFTQVDIEMAFVKSGDVMGLMESMIRKLFKDTRDIELPNPLPRMTYADAMLNYGSDKPDMRNPLILVDVGEQMKNVDFKVFSGPANDKTVVSQRYAYRKVLSYHVKISTTTLSLSAVTVHAVSRILKSMNWQPALKAYNPLFLNSCPMKSLWRLWQRSVLKMVTSYSLAQIRPKSSTMH